MRKTILTALAVCACAGQGESVGPKRPARPPIAAAKAATAGAFESLRFATVPAGTFGPYVATTASGGLAVWAQAVEQKRAWFGVAFDENGTPRGDPQRLVNAPNEVGLAIVEPEPSGFALLSTHKQGLRTQIDSLELDPRGRAKASPLALADVGGDVVWIDLVTTSRGTLALWGVKSSGGADLFAALIGQEHVQREPFARNARAWQATSLGTGAAIGVVNATGGIEVALLDDHGASTSRVAVAAGPSAAVDLDMVNVERNLLLAWSDRENLWLAAVSGDAKLTAPPARLPGAVGAETLVRLVPPHERGGKAYLAWESLLDRPPSGRKISLAAISGDAKLGSSRVVLDHGVGDGSVPELAARASGLSALTLAKACKSERECEGAQLVPTYLELDSDLRVTASLPLRISALRGEVPDLAWGLSCAMQPCRVLGAQASSPTPVWAIRVEAKPSDFLPAARSGAHAALPRVAALELVSKADPLADVAHAKLGGTSLAAWVTYFDPNAPWERLTKPAPDGKLDPVRALLQVRAIPASGAALPAETVSIRARSPGGVALAASSGSPAEALLVWTAIDFKVPQVFATVVDEKGKKLRQRMLTRAPGEKADVATAGLGDGWLVAWVDERSGDPEVYAARVGRVLQAAAPEKRITRAPGAAAEIAMIARGNDGLIAWSDARDKDQPGVGDIHVALLKGADGSLVGTETVIAKTARHSRSPALAPLGAGALLAFIEESVSASGGPGDAEVQIVELGADGRPVGAPSVLPTTGATPTALALDCREDGCRLLIAASRGGATELRVAEWARGKSTPLTRLLGLPSPPPVGIAPALAGRELIVADRVGNEGRVRRMLIDWK